MIPSYRSQKGNALFLILIAVILFAALAYAITKSENGNTRQASEDKLSIEYSKYSSIMNLAVTEFVKIRLAGCGINDIPDSHIAAASTKQRCNFFGTQGGGFPYSSSPTGYPSIGLNLMYIPGIGTDYPDVILAYTIGNDSNGEINNYNAICNYINQKNNVTYTLVSNDDLDTIVAWQESSLNIPLASPMPAAFNGKVQGCLNSDPYGGYTIYQVLEER
jgi:hypothetical protein